jgi:hypothetical protein
MHALKKRRPKPPSSKHRSTAKQKDFTPGANPADVAKAKALLRGSARTQGKRPLRWSDDDE